MNDQKPSQEGAISADLSDIAKIHAELKTAVAHMTMAVENVAKFDKVSDADTFNRRIRNPAWDAEMDMHLRHFKTSKAVVDFASWMLGQAQQEKNTTASTNLAARLNWITFVMAAAVVVQAIATGITAWLACKGN